MVDITSLSDLGLMTDGANDLPEEGSSILLQPGIDASSDVASTDDPAEPSSRPGVSAPNAAPAAQNEPEVLQVLRLQRKTT